MLDVVGAAAAEEEEVAKLACASEEVTGLFLHRFRNERLEGGATPETFLATGARAA